jgi:hypothetical protein
MSTFGELYEYLDARIDDVLESRSFVLTLDFCRQNGVDGEGFPQFLMEWSANDDLEVLFNLPRRVPQSAEIGIFTDTPVLWAARNGLYCKWESGTWVPCHASDPDARLNLNLANEQMMVAGVSGD